MAIDNRVAKINATEIHDICDFAINITAEDLWRWLNPLHAASLLFAA
jgi:hypothetical protein